LPPGTQIERDDALIDGVAVSLEERREEQAAVTLQDVREPFAAESSVEAPCNNIIVPSVSVLEAADARGSPA
jgi:hypothetical protein